LSRTVPLLPVIAYDEIVLGTNVEPVETITIRQTGDEAAEEDEQMALAALSPSASSGQA